MTGIKGPSTVPGAIGPTLKKDRRRFRREAGQIEPENLVFVDQTGSPGRAP